MKTRKTHRRKGSGFLLVGMIFFFILVTKHWFGASINFSTLAPIFLIVVGAKMLIDSQRERAEMEEEHRPSEWNDYDKDVY